MRPGDCFVHKFAVDPSSGWDSSRIVYKRPPRSKWERLGVVGVEAVMVVCAGDDENDLWVMVIFNGGVGWISKSRLETYYEKVNKQ